MLAMLDELRDSIVQWREAIIQRDMDQIRESTQRIHAMVSELSKYSPCELLGEDRQVVKELIHIALDTNQLLTQQMDLVKLAINEIQRPRKSWYA